jgi:hypothetical protein
MAERNPDTPYLQWYALNGRSRWRLRFTDQAWVKLVTWIAYGTTEPEIEVEVADVISG